VTETTSSGVAAVRRYVAAHRGLLSPLSVREALKNLDGWRDAQR
jgi:hypothetical protein